MTDLFMMNGRRLVARAYSTGLSVLHGRSRVKPGAVAIAALALTLLPQLADAQTVSGGASPLTMINNVCTFILGAFGQSLAILGIIGIGLAWMFGRASMGLVAGVIGGIVIMFGASYLGSTLTGG